MYPILIGQSLVVKVPTKIAKKLLTLKSNCGKGGDECVGKSHFLAPGTTMEFDWNVGKKYTVKEVVCGIIDGERCLRLDFLPPNNYDGISIFHAKEEKFRIFCPNCGKPREWQQLAKLVKEGT